MFILKRSLGIIFALILIAQVQPTLAQNRAIVKARVFTPGILTLVAGDGWNNGSDRGRFTGDGVLATESSLNRPWGLDSGFIWKCADCRSGKFPHP